MCGIYGSIGKDFKEIEPIFSKELSHRGPDGKGFFCDENSCVALGHTRLSIIDLSDNANQPMMGDDGNFVLVFNGEIYNYQEIKKNLINLGYKFFTESDSEVVLNSYIEFGEKCVELFRGMFAFCIYDKRKKHLFLARDRFGIKPLIYSFLNEQFVFSSELKPILKSAFVPKKLSSQAINDYFRYGAVKQPKTILEDVFQLMPGHLMRVDLNRKYEIKKYYDYVFEAKKNPKIDNYDEAVKKLRSELEIATQYHMIADVKVGAFLSGGVDSTAVVALMKKISGNKIETYSVGFKAKTKVKDETDLASKTAKLLACNHHNIKIDDHYVDLIFNDFVSHLDQPSVDGINTYIVSKETGKNLKVALSGLGGDEIFAGYPHFRNIAKFSPQKRRLVSDFAEKLNSIKANQFTSKYRFTEVREELALDMQRTFHANLEKILNLPADKNSIVYYENLSSIQKISKAEIDNYMLDTLLRDNDVLSMANSMEVRPVLLDHKLVEFVFNLDDSFKIRDGKLKAVFVDSVKNLIPKEVWQRKKSGFEMPFTDWMNGILNSRFLRVLESLKANYFLKADFLKKLHSRVKKKKAVRSDWLVFIFLAWLELYEVEI